MPAIFRFRLQKVLEFRERERDARRRELARAMEAEEAARRRCDDAARERAEHDARLCEADAGPLTPLELRARLAAVEAYEARQQQLQAVLEASTRRAETARARAIEAQRAVETVERLRERARSRWIREIETQERREADDTLHRHPEDRLP